jgi:hypothetical protein
MVWRMAFRCAAMLLFVSGQVLAGGSMPETGPGGDPAGMWTSSEVAQGLSRHSEELLGLPGVHGTALGRCGDTPCIIIYASGPSPELAAGVRSILGEIPYSIRTGEPFHSRPADP